MKKLLYIAIFLSCLFTSCQTKWDYVDTGISNGRFDGNMFEYMRSNPKDWDSTRILIEQAGLTGLFKGMDPEYKEITFLGPTNHTIRQWMLQNRIKSLRNVDETTSRKLLMRYIIKGKYMRDDIPRMTKEEQEEQAGGDDLKPVGQKFTTLGGSTIYLYTFRETYQGVENMGAVNLYVRSVELQRDINVASTNLESDNGVVQALEYAHVLGGL